MSCCKSYIRHFRFDRTLGGLEFQLRLRDYLAEQFNKVKRTKKDVRDDARAMQKLFKEAGRVKQVLSANTDHFAQVEIFSHVHSLSNVRDDHSFAKRIFNVWNSLRDYIVLSKSVATFAHTVNKLHFSDYCDN